jgi:RimJ/RimL family protein N-acetyltransferase
MAGKLVVETERFWLREYVLQDAEATFELGSNPLVQQYTGDACFTSVEEAKAVILQHPIEDYRQYSFGRWAVVPANVRSVRVLEKCSLTFEKMVQERSHSLAQYVIHTKTD